MSLNLAPIQRMVETQFLDDAVRIDPAAGVANATKVLDRETGLLVEGPVEPIYADIPAALFPANASVGRIPGVDDQQVPDETDADYKMLVALGNDAVATGQIVTVLRSKRDPRLVGERFRLTEMPTVSTFAVVRIAYLERLDEPRG